MERRLQSHRGLRQARKLALVMYALLIVAFGGRGGAQRLEHGAGSLLQCRIAVSQKCKCKCGPFMIKYKQSAVRRGVTIHCSLYFQIQAVQNDFCTLSRNEFSFIPSPFRHLPLKTFKFATKPKAVRRPSNDGHHKTNNFREVITPVVGQ